MIPRAALGGLLVGWMMAFATAGGQRPASADWGGDYPAFYAAGRIVESGQADKLYDIGTQQQMQADLLDEGFHEFLYPPFVAGFFAPLAMLPYRASYLVFTLISFAALFGALACVAPLSAAVRRDPWAAAAATACFYPFLRAMLGGQNTAISLLILCAAWRLLHDRRDVLAGIVLGVLAYKPQYLVPVAGVVLLSGRWRAIGGVAVTSILLYAAGAAISGWDWPLAWLHGAAAFAAVDRQVNAVNSISLDSLAHALGRDRLAFVITPLVSLGVASVAWREGRDDLDGVFVFGIAASVLVAPHAMFYDFGIVMPALLLLVDRGRSVAAAALWLAGASQLLAPCLPVNPMLAVAMILLVLVRREIRSPSIPVA